MAKEVRSMGTSGKGERPPELRGGERSASPQEAGRSDASRPAFENGARTQGQQNTADSVESGDRDERWSVRKKMQVVMRLLRGEDLETVSREIAVTVPELAEWREDFLRAGMEGLKTRPGDPLERKLQDALAKIGDLTMRLELWEKRGSRAGFPKRFDP